MQKRRQYTARPENASTHKTFLKEKESGCEETKMFMRHVFSRLEKVMDVFAFFVRLTELFPLRLTKTDASMARTTSKNFLLKIKIFCKIFLCGENISKSCFGAKKTQNKKLKFPIHKNFDAQKIFQRVVFIKKSIVNFFFG